MIILKNLIFNIYLQHEIQMVFWTLTHKLTYKIKINNNSTSKLILETSMLQNHQILFLFFNHKRNEILL